MGRFSVRAWMSRRDAGRRVRETAVAATNDARIVAVVLILAAAGLAWEMAVSFKL